MLSDIARLSLSVVQLLLLLLARARCRLSSSSSWLQNRFYHLVDDTGELLRNAPTAYIVCHASPITRISIESFRRLLFVRLPAHTHTHQKPRMDRVIAKSGGGRATMEENTARVKHR